MNYQFVKNLITPVRVFYALFAGEIVLAILKLMSPIYWFSRNAGNRNAVVVRRDKMLPDPAFYLNADPDPGSQINADPDLGQTLKSQKVELLREKYTCSTW